MKRARTEEVKNPKPAKRAKTTKKTISLEQKERNKENAERQKQHKKTVEEARKINVANGQRGQVIVGHQVFYRDKTPGIDKRFPLVKGFMNVSVCSGSKKWKALSPMFLGPIVEHQEKESDDKDAKIMPPATNLENLWQGCKVTKDEVKGQDEKLGEISSKFFARRKFMFSKIKGQRHAFPKSKASDDKNRNIAAFHYWEGQRLGYLEARRAIYVPLYQKYVAKTKEFAELQDLLNKGYNVQILGYDGYSVEMTQESMQKALNDKSRPFGHELVLGAMLANIELNL